ncbi:MAG: hypothetical protein K0U86_08530 [Planctomycetes bacterium]|nr:hypothetical protein [Planctomycetota bacterium]MCH9724935.1 hypothetical protein [Planctomycetota bacterium]MCH9776894.1 hypothetical protein [Planctomycetota bacterium]MCH9790961.1 hypothetical protein [Planctomycetota bacterium]MDF1743409.1 hypothetical protein [Gimesia sp.]
MLPPDALLRCLFYEEILGSTSFYPINDASQFTGRSHQDLYHGLENTHSSAAEMA